MRFPGMGQTSKLLGAAATSTVTGSVAKNTANAIAKATAIDKKFATINNTLNNLLNNADQSENMDTAYTALRFAVSSAAGLSGIPLAGTAASMAFDSVAANRMPFSEKVTNANMTLDLQHLEIATAITDFGSDLLNSTGASVRDFFSLTNKHTQQATDQKVSKFVDKMKTEIKNSKLPADNKETCLANLNKFVSIYQTAMETKYGAGNRLLTGMGGSSSSNQTPLEVNPSVHERFMRADLGLRPSSPTSVTEVNTLENEAKTPTPQNNSPTSSKPVGATDPLKLAGLT